LLSFCSLLLISFKKERKERKKFSLFSFSRLAVCLHVILYSKILSCQEKKNQKNIFVSFVEFNHFRHVANATVYVRFSQTFSF